MYRAFGQIFLSLLLPFDFCLATFQSKRAQCLKPFPRFEDSLDEALVIFENP